MHQLANLNMIRNWVGQSTGEDFYELCDKYGILVWDEFFQPNPSDGPDPTDIHTYIANVRDKILRFRNHPSIALWCARNEGYPPPEIDAALRKLMAELEPTRRYQPSSTDGAGVRSHGPYSWRTPREFYNVTDDFFKTETGSVSVPTLESIHGMMPKKDWETINDDWAEHDFARGNSGARQLPRRNCRPLWQVPQPRRLRAQGANGELRSLPRHVRGPQCAAVPSHHRHPHLDEQPGAAQLCLADLSLRSGAERVVLRRHARLRDGAHSIQRGQRRTAGHQQSAPAAHRCGRACLHLPPRRIARPRVRRESDCSA